MKTKTILLVILSALFLLSANAQDKPADAKIVTDAAAVKNALNVGAKMPAFTLKDQNGKAVSSKELVREANLVIVFYRGSWCPFCNLYLRNLQKRLPEITAAGGKLVAISVEKADASMEIAKKNEIGFTVLSDPALDTARKFRLVYQLSPETDAQYKSYGLDLAKHNEMEKPELPLAATYIVNKKGKIVYAFLETDYKKRAEPDIIIETLKKNARAAK